jgi:hypothetical protein
MTKRCVTYHMYGSHTARARPASDDGDVVDMVGCHFVPYTTLYNLIQPYTTLYTRKRLSLSLGCYCNDVGVHD